MGDWKDDRAEADMRAHEKEMMEKALLRKKQEEDAKWDALKKTIYDRDDEKRIAMVNWVIDLLRDQYELPKPLKK